MNMTTKEFMEKGGQALLPENVLDEVEKATHTGTITTTCKGHMLLSYILEYGATLMAQQLGKDEINNTIWHDIEKFIDDVNEQHLVSLEDIRTRFPEAFAEAESALVKSLEGKDRRTALLREMLGITDETAVNMVDRQN